MGKVENKAFVVALTEEDVLGLQVPMNDRRRVRTSSRARPASRPCEPRDVIRGGSQTYSKILRVGRTREGDSRVRARVEFKGQYIDLALGDDLDAGSIFRALQRDSWCRLWLDVAWERLADGSLRIVPRSTRIVRAEPFDPISGKEFLDTAQPLFNVPPEAAALVVAERAAR
jgi:hypothetical protein